MPTTRDRKKTNVFSTPWMSVSVTMSPFDTCVISWPSTASTCWRSIDSRRPVDTATSAELRNAPVRERGLGNRAGGKGVGGPLVDPPLGLAEPRGTGELMHRLDEPVFIGA